LETTFIIALSAAFALGVEHSFEPDHVVAVSTIVAQSKAITKSLLTGWLWGLGHTTVLLIAGILVLLFRVQFPPGISSSFELIVGVMLVILGIWTLSKLKRGKFHFHVHTHDSKTHAHVHSHAEGPSHEHAHLPFSVGIVHGLAGSGALVILAMSTMTGVIEGVFFMVFFGAGLIFAMSLIASALSVPSVLGGKLSSLIRPVFSAGAGSLSVALGIFVIFGFFI
jgi:ABC-type nickel/cobalt efflux system permease component RcnA